MKKLNVLIFALVAAFAAILLLFVNSSNLVQSIADHAVAFIFAIGLLGLVGAREKTPESRA